MKRSKAIRLSQKRAAKAARMSKPDGTRSKSPYAQKLQRKAGHGNPDPRWMWWLERGAA